MSHIKLNEIAATLPASWTSTRIGSAGNCNIKILKMNEERYPDEVHDYNEALVVISGVMFLEVGGEPIKVSAGEMYLAVAGVPHAVAPGSHGTLMIIDPIDPIDHQGRAGDTASCAPSMRRQDT